MAKDLQRRLVRSAAKRLTSFLLRTETIPCPLCGRTDGFEVLHGIDRYGIKIKTVKCACGFVFENPMPTEKFLNMFYSSPLFRALDWGVLSSKKDIAHEFSARERAEKHINLMRKATISPNFSILDIGASEGTFIKLVGEKFPGSTRYAVEPGTNFSQTIQGVSMTWEGIEKVPAGKTFDVITLWHVLEHVRDPRTFLSLIASHLSKDGYLFIEVPDTHRYGNDMRPIHIDHTLHFNKETLSRLLSEIGLTVVSNTNEPYCIMDELYGLAVIAKQGEPLP